MNNGKLHVKGILFDLDGTILDTRPAYIEAAKIAFQTVGHKLPPTSQLLQIPKRIELRQPITDLVPVDPKLFLHLYLKAFYDSAGNATQVMPRAIETLQGLSLKAKMAVITMRFMPKEAVMLELERLQLAKYVAHVVTALDTPNPKPSPEALIRAVEAMDVDMCDCVIVGDSVVDVKAGKAAGSKTVSVLTGLYSRQELEQTQPDYIINDVSELPELIA
jgi:HAD superfamily hydrolase (TIGR01509 family)